MKMSPVAIFTFFVVCFITTKAQSIEEIDKKIDSFNVSIEYHKQEISKLNQEITRLRNKRTEIQAENSAGIILYCNMGTVMRDKPDGNKIAQLTKGEKAILVNSNPGKEYYEISYSGRSGFAPKTSFISEEEYAKVAADMEQTKIEKERAAKERFDDLVLKYGEANAYKIVTHTYAVGWNKNMVEESIGKPDKVNRTVTQATTREQWIYNDKDLYLYFENDILESYQDSR